MNTAAARKFDDFAQLLTATRLRLVTRAGYAANDETYEYCTTQLHPLPPAYVVGASAPYNLGVPLAGAAGEGANVAHRAAQTLEDVRDQLLSVNQNNANLGAIVRYAYDGSSVLVETDTSGTTVAKFDYGPDRLLSLNRAT